jgi:hypothetical protein
MSRVPDIECLCCATSKFCYRFLLQYSSQYSLHHVVSYPGETTAFIVLPLLVFLAMYPIWLSKLSLDSKQPGIESYHELTKPTLCPNHSTLYLILRFTIEFY